MQSGVLEHDSVRAKSHSVSIHFYSPFKSLSFPLPCSRIMFQELSAIVINWIFILFFYIHFILTLHLHLMSYLLLTFLTEYDKIKTSALFYDHFCSFFLQMHYIFCPLGVRNFQWKSSKIFWPLAGQRWSLARGRDCINMTLCTHSVNYLNICLAIRCCANRLNGTEKQHVIFLFVDPEEHPAALGEV